MQIAWYSQGLTDISRRDPTQKRGRNWFWHASLARQVFAKLGPSQPERSSAANQRLCVRLAGTAQRIAGNLLRPTSFVPPNQRMKRVVFEDAASGRSRDGVRLDNSRAIGFGL